MTGTRPDHGLYAITDCDRLRHDELVIRTGQALTTGICALQYRNKQADAQRAAVEAAELTELCHRYRTCFLVNDSIELALQCGADGLHIGRDDPGIVEARRRLGPAAIIGVSCYDDLDLAVRAQQQGADYVAFGAFFPTTTKTTRTHADTGLLRQASERLTIPIVAIGGITPENGGDLIAAGADILAVASGLYGCSDIPTAIKAFQSLFTQFPKRPA